MSNRAVSGATMVENPFAAESWIRSGDASGSTNVTSASRANVAITGLAFSSLETTAAKSRSTSRAATSTSNLLRWLNTYSAGRVSSRWSRPETSSFTPLMRNTASSHRWVPKLRA